MSVEFIEPAAIELDDAIEYYNVQAEGLGDKFLDEVLRTIELISLFPQAFTEGTKHTRKALLRKFPYYLIYTSMKEKLYIIAVAHNNREPEYWIDRIVK